MDKFIIKGVCEKCGELLGTLKSVDPPAYATSSVMYTADRVKYHVFPTMTKAVMRCE